MDGRSRKSRRDEPPPRIDANDELLLTTIEDEWLVSRLRGEIEVTERLLDESYLGHTSDGLAQTKSDFLQAIQSPGTPFTESEPDQRVIRVFGDTSVSTGVITLKSVDRRHSFRYLRVFRRIAGEWRLIASQSTRLGGR